MNCLWDILLMTWYKWAVFSPGRQSHLADLDQGGCLDDRYHRKDKWYLGGLNFIISQKRNLPS